MVLMFNFVWLVPTHVVQGYFCIRLVTVCEGDAVHSITAEQPPKQKNAVIYNIVNQASSQHATKPATTHSGDSYQDMSTIGNRNLLNLFYAKLQ
jgi:hypothetical protein